MIHNTICNSTFEWIRTSYTKFAQQIKNKTLVETEIVEDSKFVTHLYNQKTGSRYYKLFIPSNHTQTQLPLVVMLHGCNQNVDDFALGTRINELAEQHKFLVVYPIQNSTNNTHKCWNWFKVEHQNRNLGEPAIIAGITQDIIQKYDIDSNRVYLAGMSAGGSMASIMSVEYPELYAAIAIHSGIPAAAAHDLQSAFGVMRNGSTFYKSSNNKKLPVIIFHGTNDKTVNSLNSSTLINMYNDNFDISTKTFEKNALTHKYSVSVYKNKSQQTMIEYWLLDGAGHNWSGGNVEGSFTDDLGPDASYEIIRFFYNHTKI